MPSPLLPTTSITYELSSAGSVSLRILDVSGRVVRALIDDHQQDTAHTVEWNGTSNSGNAVVSGVCFYRLEVPGFTQTRRMVLSR